MTHTDLKPCPCGGTVETKDVYGLIFWTECKTCGAKTGRERCHQDAIDAWNIRVRTPDTTPSHGPEIEELLERVEQNAKLFEYYCFPDNADAIRGLATALRAAEAREQKLREETLRLADAADRVGVEYFDTDDMDETVTEMQEATLAARRALGGENNDR